MRRLLTSFTLALGGCVIAVLLLEFVVRMTPLGRPPLDLRGLHERRPDRPWLYGMRPGVDVTVSTSGAVRYSVNADGFRGPRGLRPKPPGTFRIVVIGDSVAFGFGVDEADTFARVLATRLSALAGETRVEVLNLAVSGYNPYTEAALFRDVGVQYQPDLVLVQFCVNDLNDPTLHFDASTLLALHDLPDAAFPDPASRRPLAPPSVPARLCQQLRVCTLARERLGIGEPDPREMLSALAPHDEPGPTEQAWLRRQYGEIARAAQGVGAPTVLVVFPYEGQLEPNASNSLQRHLASLDDTQSWYTIDLLPTFRNAADSTTSPLFLDLWHPTSTGHRVAGEAIAHQLSCAGLVPWRDPACPPTS